MFSFHPKGVPDEFPGLSITSYTGKTPEQCDNSALDNVRELCPKISRLYVGLTFPETFLALGKYRGLTQLTLCKLANEEHLDLPLMAFGHTLVKLELKSCLKFQSGSALHIRKYCTNLQTLLLDIENVDSNSNSGISEAFEGTQNVWTLQHQVMDLQSRLNQLQVN